MNFLSNEIKSFVMENKDLNSAQAVKNCDNLKLSALAAGIALIAMGIFMNVGLIISLAISAFSVIVIHDVSLVTEKVQEFTLGYFERDIVNNDSDEETILSFMTQNTIIAASLLKLKD
jgi:hypothetical protein